MLLGQSRVFYSMARDGLATAVREPRCIRASARHGSPSIVTGVGVAIFPPSSAVRDAAASVPSARCWRFVIVSVDILVLRVREPDLPRKFTHAVGLVCRAGGRALRACAHGGATMADMATFAWSGSPSAL